MLPPDSVVRHKEAGVKLPNHCIAIGFEQSFRTGAARLRVRAARVAAADGGGDPARSARLTLAIGHGSSAAVLWHLLRQRRGTAGQGQARS